MTRRILSGIQPTGLLHVGNYFGAIKNWVALQEPAAGEQSECLYCVVDYHSITVAQEPAELRRRTLELTTDLLACGIDPARSALFLQSQVPEHTELAWILSSVTAYGDLTRMTQFKEKSGAQDLVSAGLFTYPVLMAADILAYKASHVPVGEDQLQHLELTREIARRFNQRYGQTFPDPKPLLTQATRVMSLADPTKKMSKSAGERHYVGVFEDEASIRKKLKSAVTDVGGVPTAEMSPGVKNLFLILEQTAPEAAIAPLRAAQQAGALRYAELKEAVASHLITALAPLRERRARLTEAHVRAVLEQGAARARAIAAATLEEARERIGILQVSRGRV